MFKFRRYVLFKRNKILKKICYPHIAIVVILTAISIFGLIYSFAFNNPIPFFQYLFYVISAYTLTIICFRIPRIIKLIKTFTKKNKLIARYKADFNYRNKVSLYSNTSANILCMLFYLILGIINNSFWFYSLAIYYILLSIIRFFLLKDIHKGYESNLKQQWLRYKFCGIILVIINIAFSIITFFVIHLNQGFSYHYIETIAIALFTFITTTLAIINSIRYRKFKQPIISAINFVSLSSALVSMFSLETAMLIVFGSPSDYLFKRIITTVTGTIFSLIILSIGIFMITKSTQEIKKIKNETASHTFHNSNFFTSNKHNNNTQ